MKAMGALLMVLGVGVTEAARVPRPAVFTDSVTGTDMACAWYDARDTRRTFHVAGRAFQCVSRTGEVLGFITHGRRTVCTIAGAYDNANCLAWTVCGVSATTCPAARPR